MALLRSAAIDMSYLAYGCHVQKGRTTRLEILPKPRVFSKSTLHTLLIAQSFIEHLPEATPGDSSWASWGGAVLPGRHRNASAEWATATEKE